MIWNRKEFNIQHLVSQSIGNAQMDLKVLYNNIQERVLKLFQCVNKIQIPIGHKKNPINVKVTDQKKKINK